MDELFRIDLTSHERDLVLKGLRFVRSSIMLQMRDPVPDDEHRRSCLLDEIQNLSQRLETADADTADIKSERSDL